jgi:hypothetical protein
MTIFSPLSYGAIVDDPTAATVNAAAFNAMISAVNSNGNGEIILPVGKLYSLPITTPTLAPCKWQGDTQLTTTLICHGATGDFLTLNNYTKMHDIGFDHDIVRTAGATLRVKGNGVLVSDLYMLRSYQGIVNDGQLNVFNNNVISAMTPRRIAPMSGAFLNTTAKVNMSQNKVGSGTMINADMAEFGYRIVNGEINMSQCDAFLCNQNFLADPGDGQKILGINLSQCWLDTAIQTALAIKPAHATAQINYVTVDGCELAPGNAGATPYAAVFDCGPSGGLIGKCIFTNNVLYSYTNGLGVGVYLNGGARKDIEFQAYGNKVGMQDSAFDTGWAIKGNTSKWNIAQNVTSRCRVGMEINAGCDKFISAPNTYDTCSIPVYDISSPSYAIRSPNLVY